MERIRQEEERKRQEERNKCGHSYLERKILTGDTDFQQYKHIRCSGNMPVMYGIASHENGTVCNRCRTNFCGHIGCSCKH